MPYAPHPEKTTYYAARLLTEGSPNSGFLSPKYEVLSNQLKAKRADLAPGSNSETVERRYVWGASSDAKTGHRESGLAESIPCVDHHTQAQRRRPMALTRFR